MATATYYMGGTTFSFVHSKRIVSTLDFSSSSFYKLNIQREYCRDQTVFQLANGFVIRVVSRSLLCAKWANECALLFCSRRQRTPTTLRAKSKFDCVADVLRQIKTSRTIGASSTVIVCVCMSCEHHFLNHFAVFLPLSARLRQGAYGAGWFSSESGYYWCRLLMLIFSFICSLVLLSSSWSSFMRIRIVVAFILQTKFTTTSDPFEKARSAMTQQNYLNY